MSCCWSGACAGRRRSAKRKASRCASLERSVRRRAALGGVVVVVGAHAAVTPVNVAGADV